MEKDLGQIFHELKEDLSEYVELKLELLKLTTYERAGKLVAVLSYGLAMVVLALLATLFLFIALGIFLGELLHSISAGLAIIGGIYLLIIGLLILSKKWFVVKVWNIVISALTNEDKDKEYERDADAIRKTNF